MPLSTTRRVIALGALLGLLALQSSLVSAAPESGAAADYAQRSGSRSQDLTGDGAVDVLTREPGVDDGALWLYPGSGKLQGRQTLGQRTQIGRGWNGFNWIGVAEITGDPKGHADVLARRASDGALLVYPHSGTVNGLNTLGEPVLLGTGWNELYEIVLADVTGDGNADILGYDLQDNLWLYPHSGTFQGTATFGERTLVRQGRLGWLYATPWSTDRPDLVTNFVATGDMVASAHSGAVDGTNTWSPSSTTLARGKFTGDLLDILSLADLNGDGRDDVLVRGKDGSLVVFPFTGVAEGNSFGRATVIGSGWGGVDLLT
ncbi:hypothetical protein D5S17_04975 [Pseudonocardiaceae bacterium YIM PH 21723]|nr:hypothetical protein D5S17_04975 [Pseudonocardiaceae bacterium YIM PH 21723]